MKISRLTLYTKNLSGQKTFYGETLGLSLVNESDNTATFLLRNTAVTFCELPGATPYHFAVNIPSNTIVQALGWLKDRVEILKDQEQEIHDFTAWNAHSVYCYDADNNILELIARNNLGYSPGKAFGTDSLIEISEIGLAVSEISPYYEKLNRFAGLKLFDGNMQQFSAIGDEYGLFICINRLRKTWYPSGDKAYPSGFELTFTQKNREFDVRFENEILTINRNLE
jgi:catechol-2,3-dioxygenase